MTAASDDQAMRRALAADDLLKNSLLIEAFDALKNQYVIALRKCDAKDDLGRFRYARALDDIDVLFVHLRSVIANGKLTAEQSQAFQKPTLVSKINRVF